MTNNPKGQTHGSAPTLRGEFIRDMTHDTP